MTTGYVIPLVSYKAISDDFEGQYEQYVNWLEENSTQLVFTEDDL